MLDGLRPRRRMEESHRCRVIRQWRPRLEEVNREVRHFGITVPAGVEHVGLGARTQHDTDNWLVITDCSNAFNTVKRMRLLAEVVTASQRSRRRWPSDVVQYQLTYVCRNLGRPGRSLAPAVSRRGTS